MKLRTCYTECDYITAGKLYDVIELDFLYPHELADIMADDGTRITVWFTGLCAHLDCTGRWEVVDENAALH